MTDAGCPFNQALQISRRHDHFGFTDAQIKAVLKFDPRVPKHMVSDLKVGHQALLRAADKLGLPTQDKPPLPLGHWSSEEMMSKLAHMLKSRLIIMGRDRRRWPKRKLLLRDLEVTLDVSEFMRSKAASEET